MEYDKFVDKYLDLNDDSGFNEILYSRQTKLNAIRHRLKRYHLSDAEIEKQMEIIINAEIEMEKIKRKFNSKKYTEDDLIKFQDKLIDIQKKMKDDFDKRLNKILKDKYENAKRILEQQKNKKINPDFH